MIILAQLLIATLIQILNKTHLVQIIIWHVPKHNVKRTVL